MGNRKGFDYSVRSVGFIPTREKEPPSPFCEWPSPPRGRAINPLRRFIKGRAIGSDRLSVRIL